MCLVVAACLLEGCNVGPKYNRPPVQTPAAYKELTPNDYKNTDGWKVAQPKDDALHGKWWEIFGDPELNALEEKVNVSNQNIAAATANFFAARALVKEARSQLFPTVTTNPSIVGQRPSATVTGGKSPSGATPAATTFAEYSLPFDATWQPDLFGRIHNTINSAAFGAQASAADLENTRLTVQADLAMDYFQLRGQDSLKEIARFHRGCLSTVSRLHQGPIRDRHRHGRSRGRSRNSTRSHASTGRRPGHPAGAV